MSELTNDELVEIFNNVLDASSFVITIQSFGLIEYPSHRDMNHMKKYYDKKQFDIESGLAVFESIPKNKIYKIIEDFISELEQYVRSKQFKSKEAKNLQNKSYKLIKKDIKTIEEYQAMIYDYTADNDWNDDEQFTILNPLLDDIYQTNKKLLIELKTKQYKILDSYRYGGTNLYDSTKKPIKRFFKTLQKEYSIKTLNIKQMIDVL